MTDDRNELIIIIEEKKKYNIVKHFLFFFLHSLTKTVHDSFDSWMLN